MKLAMCLEPEENERWHQAKQMGLDYAVAVASPRPELPLWDYQTERYRGIIDKVGGRWVPIYPALLDDMPLFKGNPKFAAFREMAETGIVDGYAGPPNALAGNIFDANLVTRVLQKIIVDGMAVGDAVAWGQKEMEALAAKG